MIVDLMWLSVVTHFSTPLGVGPAVNNKSFLAEVEDSDAFLTRYSEPKLSQILLEFLWRRIS
jgi:hypothetical protein